jgi:hypothetical protein
MSKSYIYMYIMYKFTFQIYMFKNIYIYIYTYNAQCIFKQYLYKFFKGYKNRASQ